MRISLAKGMRDFQPAEQIGRNRIIGTLRRVFEGYGFRPLDTPAIENIEVLSAKYAGGDEILKETFQLTDRGNRKLGLRYDLTVPLARFIAMNPQLKFPFKRYQISKVWRDGPMGMGRYREFWQCDVDTVGCKSKKADAEVLAIVADVFKELKLDIGIRVNNRKLLNGIFDYLKVSDKEIAMVVIDKLDKLDRKGLLKEFSQKGLSTGEIILNFFESLPKSNSDMLKFFKTTIKSEEGLKGLEELEELFAALKPYKIKLSLSPELARGLSYYTSTIFEVFVINSKITSSVAGGGRYDSMIGKYLGSPQEYPAVGISFGMDRIYDALLDLKLIVPSETLSEVFVIPIGTNGEEIGIVKELRAAGISAETDISGKGISKNLSYANSLGIPFVIFVGKTELESGKLKLRDMQTGKEQLLELDKVMEILKSDLP